MVGVLPWKQRSALVYDHVWLGKTFTVNFSLMMVVLIIMMKM